MPHPNLLLICTGHQRYDALGCCGNPYIFTTHLDALAAEGVRYENCTITSTNGERTRKMILPTPRPLIDAGYDCGLIGSLNGAPADGWKVIEYAPDETTPDSAYHSWLTANFPGHYAAATDPADSLGFQSLPAESHYSHWLAERSIQYIESAQKPFFLFANFADPQAPCKAPLEVLERYAGAALPMPLEDTRSTWPSYLAEGLAAFAALSPYEVRAAIRAYYAMISLIDDEVQRMLNALDALNLRENTLVIYTASRGEMLGDHGLMRAPALYETGVRVPLILRWPDVLPAGERRAGIVQTSDIYHTLMDAAGLRHVAELSLLRAPVRAWALCKHRELPARVTLLRDGSYKLIQASGTDEDELYDLAADPHEQDNLWHSRPELRRELEKRLIAIEHNA